MSFQSGFRITLPLVETAIWNAVYEELIDKELSTFRVPILNRQLHIANIQEIAILTN